MTCYFAQFFKDDSLIFVKQNMFLDLRVSVPLWECILKSYFPTFQLFEKRPLKQENTRADIWQRIYLEEKMIDEVGHSFWCESQANLNIFFLS